MIKKYFICLHQKFYKYDKTLCLLPLADCKLFLLAISGAAVVVQSYAKPKAVGHFPKHNLWFSPLPVHVSVGTYSIFVNTDTDMYI